MADSDYKVYWRTKFCGVMKQFKYHKNVNFSGKECITLKAASEKLVQKYDTICEIAVQQNHKKLKGSGDGNMYPMAGLCL